MKLAVLGDIHGNFPALNSALTQLEQYEIDKYYCTGDLVGVLGWNNEVVSQVRQFDFTVMGNHEARVNPKYQYDPEEKYSSIERKDLGVVETYLIKDQLTKSNYEWLLDLDEEIYDPDTDVYMTHSNPNISGVGMERGDAGVRPREVAEVQTNKIPGYWIFLGHSHQATEQKLDKFPGKEGHLVNPGSIGFPLNGTTSFAVVDTVQSSVSLETATYDLQKVENKLMDTGIQSIADEIRSKRSSSRW